MKKAVCYLRVSTETQASEGISLLAQEQKCRQWSELNDYDVVEIHIDAGISGKSTSNRPALQDALKSIGKGDALVVYSLSRLSRSTKDTLSIAELLEKKKADLVSITERIDTLSSTGKMVFRLLSVLAEFERDQVSERTKLALAHKKSIGEKTGGSVPYGYKLDDDGKKLLPVPEEQEVIRSARKLKDAGNSLRAIAKILAGKGFKTRNNKEFSAIQIQRLMVVNGN